MKYHVTVETLTPLHIGTGAELLKDFDYVSRAQENRTYMLDQEAVYGAEVERNGATARLDRPAGHVLASEHWREGSPFVRYTLKGSTSIERIRAQIKDADGRCYLPGSSLKGALRTALMKHLIAVGLFKPRLNRLDSRRKEFAAHSWEQELFGRDPNHDLLRALHVADSRPLPLVPSALELLPARVFAGGEPGSPIVVEAVSSKQAFKTEVLVDELTLKYAPQLEWENQAPWLTSFPRLLQETAEAHIEGELVFAADKGFTDTEKFYRQLADLARSLRGKSAAVLQLGWGTGWLGMTVGRVLSLSDRDTLRQRFSLGRPPTAPRSWELDLNKPFPKSRRLRVTSTTSGDTIPGRPLGWVIVWFEEAAPATPEWLALARQAQSLFKPLGKPGAPIQKQAPEPQRVQAPPPAPEPEPPAQTVEPMAPPAAEVIVPVEPSAPARRPFTASFSELPQLEDRFRGTVIFTDRGTIFIRIPGLADDFAMAVIAPKNNSEGRKYKDDAPIKCEVIEAARRDPQDPSLWLVPCRLD